MAVALSEDAAPDDIDYIDGPAKVRTKPKGSVVATLPDNTKVRVLKTQGEWTEVSADGVRGWTARSNLMSSHVGATDADGFYVLSRAAYLGYADTVRFLLARGARTDLVDKSGKTALHWVISGGEAGIAQNQLNILSALAAIPGESVNIMDMKRTTPLHDAIMLRREDMTTVLLGNPNIDVNTPTAEGLTPLMLAINSNQPQTVASLLNFHQLNADAVDEEDRSALFHALARKDQTSAEALLERKVRTDTINKDGKTLLHALFESQPTKPISIELANNLLDRKDIDINRSNEAGATAMALAIRQFNVPMVKLFLSRPELDVNKPTTNNDRYLHSVIGLPNHRQAVEIAMLLLDRPEIDINAANLDYDGNTLIHDLSWYSATSATSGEITKKILARNPQLDARNKNGETPLIFNINRGNVAHVRLLVSLPGIDLGTPDGGSGKTPLSLAKYSGKKEIVDILTAAGAPEFPLVGDKEYTPEGIPQRLLQNGSASSSISFYRSYLLDTTDRTLRYLHDNKTDDAIKSQEYILDEILAEVGDSIPKCSREQRTRAVETFSAIKDYYRQFPRSQNACFKALPDNKKALYTNLDAMRDEVVNGKYASAPEGELTDHPPMMPILILRGYMAQNAIRALTLMREGKPDAAEQFLQSVKDKSTSKYQVLRRYSLGD